MGITQGTWASLDSSPRCPALITDDERRSYRMPVAAGWCDYTTIDTFYGVLPYSEEHRVAHLAAQALHAGAGAHSTIAGADAHLFDACPTVGAITKYLEEHF